MFDEDIKIAEFDKQNQTKNKKEHTSTIPNEYETENAKGNILKAKNCGIELADAVIGNINKFSVAVGDADNAEIASQRGILMTFAATIAVEEVLTSSIVSNTAKNSFNAELERLSPSLFKAVSDSGAFSFYYLAYRRGSDVVRRIGQTFAMLCSHDGDPVYHELGEAIYCWFKSFAEKLLNKSQIN